LLWSKRRLTRESASDIETMKAGLCNSANRSRAINPA
jgi:hypothetical protein